MLLSVNTSKPSKKLTTMAVMLPGKLNCNTSVPVIIVVVVPRMPEESIDLDLINSSIILSLKSLSQVSEKGSSAFCKVPVIPKSG